MLWVDLAAPAVLASRRGGRLEIEWLSSNQVPVELGREGVENERLTGSEIVGPNLGHVFCQRVQAIDHVAVRVGRIEFGGWC